MHDFLLKYFLMFRIKFQISYEENQCLLIGLNTHRENKKYLKKLISKTLEIAIPPPFLLITQTQRKRPDFN